MRSTIALATLSLLASSVIGAPVPAPWNGGLLSGSVSSNANANANVNVHGSVHGNTNVAGEVLTGAHADVKGALAAGAAAGASAHADVKAAIAAGASAGAAASASAKAELKLFADLLISVVSGGKHTALSAADWKSLTTLTANLNIAAFTKFTNGVCVSAYSNGQACTELSAFLSATYWAHLAGWAGADLFAALGATRLDRWHGLLSGVCATSAGPQGACTSVFAQFDAWVAAAANVQATVISDSRIKLDAFGLLSTIDASAVLKVGANGFIKIGHRSDIPSADFDRRILGNVVAGAKAKIDAAIAATLTKQGLSLGAVTGVAADGILIVDGKLLPDVLASLGLKLDSNSFLSINKGGLFLFSSTNAHANAGAHVPRLLGNGNANANVLAAVKAKADAALAATVDKNGLRLGAITGIAADGVLLVDGVRLVDVLAKVGVKVDSKTFVDIGKDGLYLFSSTDASIDAAAATHVSRGLHLPILGLTTDAVAHAEAEAEADATAVLGGPQGSTVSVKAVAELLAKLGVKVPRAEAKRILGSLGNLGNVGGAGLPVIPDVLAAGQAGVGAVGSVVVGKNGIAAGVLGNAAGAGFLGIN